MKDLIESERQKYERVYTGLKYAMHSPHWRCWERISDEIRTHNTYANFGCGSGLLDQKILAAYPDIKGILIDHVSVLWPDVKDNPRVTFHEASLFGELPRFEVPYAVSTDVMEHIPPEMVDTVLESIRDRSESAFFQISLDPTSEKKAIKYGGHLHLTVEDTDWWLAKLRKHFDKIVTPQRVMHSSEQKQGWLAVTVRR